MNSRHYCARRFATSRTVGIAFGVLFTILFGLAPSALAVDTTWTSDNDGLWTDGGTWDNGEPTDNSYNVFIDEGDSAVTVTLDVARSIGSLTVGSDDTLLMLTDASVAQLNLDSGVINDGSVIFQSNGSYTYFYMPSATFQNNATGTLHFDTGGSSVRYFATNLVNDGTVTVDHETYFDNSSGSYTNNNQLTLASGVTLRVNNGSTLYQENGIFDLSGTLNLSGSTYIQNDGQLNFSSGALVDGGRFEYQGGSISGTVQLRGSTLVIGAFAANPATFLMNDNNTLDSGVGGAHTIRMEAISSSVQLVSNSGFTNDGTIEMTSSVPGVYTYLQLTSGTLTNSATGLLDFQAGQGDRYLDANLDNYGTVQVNHTSQFSKGGGQYRNYGQFNVASGAIFTVSGNGIFDQDDGTFDLDGELEIGGSTFNVNGGTFDFDDINAIIENGNFNYNGGTIVGTPKLRSVNLSIAPTATNSATFLMNDNNMLASDVGAGHTIRMEAINSSVQLTSNNNVTNDGTIEMISSNAGAYTYLYLSNSMLTNSATGQLLFQANAGDRYLDADLVNNGLVQLDQNTNFNKGGGSYTNNAQFNVASGAVFTISGNGIFDQNDGTFDLDGELEIGGSTFNVNGGTFDIDAASIIDNGNFNYAGGTIVGTPKLRGATLSIQPTATNPATFLMNDNNMLASDVGAGHTIRMEAVSSSVQLTSNSSFTNDGLIEMTSTIAGNYTYLYLPTGTLTNSSTGVLHFQADQGDRYLDGDLVNNGTVQVDQTTTYFYKGGGFYTNNGLFLVSSGGTLRIVNGGTLTNFSGNTLTGGTYEVAGTFRFAGADIITNQAEIILSGLSSQILDENTSADALANFGLNDTNGIFRLLDNRSFTAGGPFTNQGLIELGGGELGALSLDNAAGAQIFGYGAISVRPTNYGHIRAAGGTLFLYDGIQGGSGTVTVDPGATLDLSAGTSSSSADDLIHNGDELALGDNDFLVENDYQNENFGSGNSFNHRANVTGAGQINADPAVTQSLLGNVTNGNTATATMGFGNVHVGSSTTKNYFVRNNGASGPDLRGAIQTSVNGGNITDGRLSGTGVTASNFGPIAPSTNAIGVSVTFNATSAGALTGQQVHITNNFDNVADQDLVITGAAYRLANPTAHTPEPINFGNRHVGDANPSQTLSITNNVPADGFSESLNASLGSATGGVTASGSFNALAPGATNNTSMSVGFSTATAGNKSGTATITLTSSGTGSSGLGNMALTSQTVNVFGAVYRLASASAHTPEPINFGIRHVGDPAPSQTLSLTNNATNDGFSERLRASIGTITPTGGVTTNGGSFTNLAPGATNNSSLSVGIDTSTAGVKNGTATITLTSDGAGTSGLGLTSLTSQIVNVIGTVNNYAVAQTLKLSGGGTFTMTAPNTFSLDFGTFTETPGTLSTVLGVKNNVAAPADSLAGSFVTTAGGFSLSGFSAFSGLAAGSTQGGLNVQLNSSVAGTYAGQITLNPQSTNPTPFTLNLAPITVNLSAKILLPGDFNFDNSVDAADYVMMKKLFDTPANDAIWRQNFGRTVSGSGGSLGAAGNPAVPEPTAVALVLIGLMTSAVLRRR